MVSRSIVIIFPNLKYHESQSVYVESIHFDHFGVPYQGWYSFIHQLSTQHPWTGAGHGHHSSGLCFEQQRTHARHQLPRWVLKLAVGGHLDGWMVDSCVLGVKPSNLF